MKVLLTGVAGQLGQALRQQLPAGVELIATSCSGGNGLLALDLADAGACRAEVLEHRPDWVLNAGAYTAVDRAESEPELAMAVNGGALRAFAEALLDAGGSLLQVSEYGFCVQRPAGQPLPPRTEPRFSRYLWPHQGCRRGSGGSSAGRQRPGRDPAHQLGDRPGGQEPRPHHAAASPRT
jgi:nucleoside-diphosphate-sugar epimerase